MTLHAAFRADASAEMGTGHFMRSLTLARAWRAAGGESLIMTATDNQALIRRAQVHSVPLLRLGHGDAGLKATGLCVPTRWPLWGAVGGRDTQACPFAAELDEAIMDASGPADKPSVPTFLDLNGGRRARTGAPVAGRSYAKPIACHWQSDFK